MKKGGKYSTVASVRKCEICKKYEGSVNYYTDGYWIWPEWVYHYIDCHGLKLPNLFIDNIRKKKYIVEKEFIDQIVRLEDVEIDFHPKT